MPIVSATSATLRWWPRPIIWRRRQLNRHVTVALSIASGASGCRNAGSVGGSRYRRPLRSRGDNGRPRILAEHHQQDSAGTGEIAPQRRKVEGLRRALITARRHPLEEVEVVADFRPEGREQPLPAHEVGAGSPLKVLRLRTSMSVAAATAA